MNRICSFVVRNAACVRFFSRLTYLFWWLVQWLESSYNRNPAAVLCVVRIWVCVSYFYRRVCVDTPANARLIRREENRRTNRSRECENYVSIWLCICRRRDTFVFKATTVEWACISWFFTSVSRVRFFLFFFFILILSALLTDRSAKRSTFFLTRQIGGKGNKMHILRVIFVCTEKRGVINSYSCATFPRSVTCGIFTTSVKY